MDAFEPREPERQRRTDRDLQAEWCIRESAMSWQLQRTGPSSLTWCQHGRHLPRSSTAGRAAPK